MHFAAGQPPQQIAIDGAEHQLPALGTLARAWDVVEDPRDFGAGEIGIDDQAGSGRYHRLMALGLQAGADIGGAAVLPDDGAMHRLAGGAVPHDSGLALVGDADRGDVFRGEAGLLDRLAADRCRRGPDILRLMLDPARRGKMLRKFLLRRCGDGNVASKHDGARGCGALIDGQHKGHWRCFPRGCLEQGKRIGEQTSICRCRAILHPPLEGEGRLALSEARCETGWGDGLSTRSQFETRDRHPTPPLPGRRFASSRRVDPPPPGEGKNAATPMRSSRRRRRRWSGRS